MSEIFTIQPEKKEKGSELSTEDRELLENYITSGNVNPEMHKLAKKRLAGKDLSKEENEKISELLADERFVKGILKNEDLTKGMFDLVDDEGEEKI